MVTEHVRYARGQTCFIDNSDGHLLGGSMHIQGMPCTVDLVVPPDERHHVEDDEYDITLRDGHTLTAVRWSNLKPKLE